MKKTILILSVLVTANFAQANGFLGNPTELSGQCVGLRTKIITPFVGVDPEMSFGVFMRNDGVMGTEDRPFSIRGQYGMIYVRTPDYALSFSISTKPGTKVNFGFSSRLGIDSQESDEFQCKLEFK
jgi:hypothetical protein